MNAQDWISRLNLLPHPEGGYFKENYRANHTLPRAALPRSFKGPRSVSTAIYFLLKRGQISRLHRIAADELWHHYAGGSLIIHGLTPQGRHIQYKLGTHPERGETPQVMIPAGTWFGANLAPRAAFALVGCTVAPGFDFADFEMGNASTLLKAFPKHKAVINALCPGSKT
jgi:hypothetical protein